MLTETTNHMPCVSNLSPMSHDETVPNAEEIARRVLAIRAGWDLRERISRRRVGQKRLNELLNLLQAA